MALIPEISSEVLDEAILDEAYNSFIFFYCYNSHFLSSADEYFIIGALVMNFGQITESFFPKKNEES
ncbi:hypothetical protein ACM6Q7_06745 [Peribacillus butanolivorans]